LSEESQADCQAGIKLLRCARFNANLISSIGAADPAKSPSIAGMQARTGGRPPNFFDEELRVMQFVARNNKTTVG
jgi:hypothetical protein